MPKRQSARPSKSPYASKGPSKAQGNGAPVRKTTTATRTEDPVVSQALVDEIVKKVTPQIVASIRSVREEEVQASGEDQWVHDPNGDSEGLAVEVNKASGLVSLLHRKATPPVQLSGPVHQCEVHQGVSQDIPARGHTPIKIDPLISLLDSYPDIDIKTELIMGFTIGFDLHYSGPRQASECNNLVSVKNNEKEALKLVLKEVNLGRIAGPFLNKPFPNLRLSPIGLVPKKDDTFRLIHHLSYPHGSSVNDFIDSAICSVQYASFDNAIVMISALGRGAFLGKMDIKSAFRLLPVRPSDFELLGFTLGGKFFYDMCLPMGCSISCSLFEKFSTFLEWAVKRRAKRTGALHYLDDFLFGGQRDSNDCAILMDSFSQLCSELGVPVADDKTVGPTHVLIFLGLEIDSIEMIVRIPIVKVVELRQQLSWALEKKKITLKALQSLTGLLNFCARAIPSARAFCRRFYDAMSGVSKPHHFLRVSKPMKEDMKMWLLFLDNFNGSCYFPESEWVNSLDLQLFTDAAGGAELGCAAYFAPFWTFFQWPEAWRGTDLLKDVSFLELVPIVLAFQTWGSYFKGKKIILHTDNMALVSILNKKSSRSWRVMHLIRPLVLQTMFFGIQCRAVHIEGKLNNITDALSRKQWVRFQHLAPRAERNPSPVPESFQLLISSLKLTDC